MQIIEKCVEAYQRNRNLKIAANEVGIPWQTLYVHLKKAGEPVTGDKLKYGSSKDRLAAKSEQLFVQYVPQAKDMNAKKFQSKIDFDVNGYGVDVKSSSLKLSGHKCSVKRWAFCIKKQEMLADFFVCIGFDEEGEKHVLTLLIPGEIARKYTSISLSSRGGKWSDYQVDIADLKSFFDSLGA